jgi:hypothetical protein
MWLDGEVNGVRIRCLSFVKVCGVLEVVLNSFHL